MDPKWRKETGRGVLVAELIAEKLSSPLGSLSSDIDTMNGVTNRKEGENAKKNDEDA